MAVETHREPADRAPAAQAVTDGLVVDWLGALGLARDPLAAQNPPFFAGAGRRELLEQLLHQCQFSASALVVSGEIGVGKSTLKRELLSHLGSDDAVCCIDVPAIYHAEQLLGEVIRGFGLQVEEGASRGKLLSEIRRFGQTGEDGSLALLVVDNAHHLDDQLLAALLSLLQGQEDSIRPLHLVLFGDPSLALRLDAFGIVEVLIHDMIVEPLSRDQVAEYLDFCLAQAGFSGDFPFADGDIDSLWQASQGIPAKLNPLARQRLIELATPAPTRRRSPLLPMGHMLAVTALGAILLVALFYSEGEPEPETRGDESPLIVMAPPQPATATGSEESQPQAPEQAPPAAPKPAADAVEALAPVVPDAELARLPAPAAGPGPDRPEPPSSTPPPAADPTSLSPDETQLLARQASAYTLQVLAAASEDSVRRFVRRQADPGALQVFTTRRRGQDWYVVVHGSFPDAASARRAIAALPPALREAGPWPRSIASVQTEIKEYHGN